jgi:hypothetical protein
MIVLTFEVGVRGWVAVHAVKSVLSLRRSIGVSRSAAFVFFPVRIEMAMAVAY